MPRAIASIILASLVSSAAYAEEAQPWYDGNGPSAAWFSGEASDEENMQAIKNCLDNMKGKQACFELKLKFDGPNWGAEAAQRANEWSIIGQELLEKIMKKNPDQAQLIKDTQTAWYAYVDKLCELGSKMATYEDDDENGEHPAYYDWVTNISCIYSYTMDRVISLHAQARN